MKKQNEMSRRRFLQSTGALGGASLFRVGAPSLVAITQAACSARDEVSAFQTLGAEEAADFAAIAARIIPTTDTPGATEAGVIWFWDKALGADFDALLPDVRALREQMNANLDKPFAELSATEQDAALRTVENDYRFEFWRLMTIFGFFSMAKHGGNKDHISWDLIGFKGHHGAWTPPFGYYDAQAEHANDE
ncbi:MAG: gluconate 2-dehydrogenase subunit 3 family protein [Woeseiaceae bacterium]|jgi:gluconate 2-dehydrogenase gamma chain